MKIENLIIKIAHSKPYYPSKENAEKNIIHTLKKGLDKFNEIEGIVVGTLHGSMEVSAAISFKDMSLDKASVIENRINKIGRNLAKKYNVPFNTINLTKHGT